MHIDLSGKRALILGASGGLGSAIATGLREAGADIAVVGRSAERLQAAMPEAKARIVADLAAAGAPDAIADQALAALGGVDILVNNSGGPPPSPALGVSAEVWKAQFEAMVLSLMKLTDRLAPGMVERKWGRILTIASSGVQMPIPNLAVSNTLRSALVGWSKTLATELAPHGVTVNMVLPGRIATSRVASLDAAAAQRTGRTAEEVEAASRAAIPMGRYGRPEEFAAAAVFLASPQASYVTGTTIRIDGGMIRSI
ncbi:SDR family oxidoreductase [Labrys monachus]|uniref:3-oxoacyl-[acyl-carrier protein] reductase n=1 Tax=Labrys monachus TaxID=217067 RepID=A0ABU0FAA7_9HYPH|nr:SDR family oxidoreductase [Labrys monachus]MDQ0391262.1 3-oxoacyl-[acyl-carrier protein] reductase [Labrys monachus]